MPGCSEGLGLMRGTSPNIGAVCLVVTDLRSKTRQHWFYFFGEVIESKLSPVCLKAGAGADAGSGVRTGARRASASGLSCSELSARSFCDFIGLFF